MDTIRATRRGMAIAHRRRCAVDGVIRLLEESTFERRHAVACGRSGRPWERRGEPRRRVGCLINLWLRALSLCMEGFRYASGLSTMRMKAGMVNNRITHTATRALPMLPIAGQMCPEEKTRMHKATALREGLQKQHQLEPRRTKLPERQRQAPRRVVRVVAALVRERSDVLRRR